MIGSLLEASTTLSLGRRKYWGQSGLLGYSLKRAVPFLTQLFCVAGRSVNTWRCVLYARLWRACSDSHCMWSPFKEVFSSLGELTNHYYVPDILLSTSPSWPLDPHLWGQFSQYPTSQTRRLSLRDLKWFAQRHTGSGRAGISVSRVAVSQRTFCSDGNGLYLYYPIQ